MLYRWNGANDPSGCLSPKSSSVLDFGVAVNAKVDTLGRYLRFLHLCQDRVVELFLWGLSFRLLRLGLFEGPGGKYGLEALGTLTGLGRVCLVDDQGEPACPEARRSP